MKTILIDHTSQENEIDQTNDQSQFVETKKKQNDILSLVNESETERKEDIRINEQKQNEEEDDDDKPLIIIPVTSTNEDSDDDDEEEDYIEEEDDEDEPTTTFI